MEENIGRIKQIRGQIVEVEFLANKPAIHDILVLEDDPSITLEVFASSDSTSFYCIVFDKIENLFRGAKLINTQKSVQIPVGKAVLGRVMNLFGRPLDGKGEIKTKETKSIYSNEVG